MAKRRGGRFKKMLGLGFISFEKAFSNTTQRCAARASRAHNLQDELLQQQRSSRYCHAIQVNWANETKYKYFIFTQLKSHNNE
jgi:hypothetical protein